MSQRNESTILILALFATIALVGGGLWWFIERWANIANPKPTNSVTSPGTNPPSIPGSVSTSTKSVTDRISLGEKILVPTEGGDNVPFQTLKQAGVYAIVAGKNDEAVSQLQGALQQNPNAPETLIYLNNARIGNKKAYTIGVVAPIVKNRVNFLNLAFLHCTPFSYSRFYIYNHLQPALKLKSIISFISIKPKYFLRQPIDTC